ncbi:MAG: hypothetical protein WA309_15170 [Pseudolabrys sp.]
MLEMLGDIAIGLVLFVVGVLLVIIAYQGMAKARAFCGSKRRSFYIRPSSWCF